MSSFFKNTVHGLAERLTERRRLWCLMFFISWLSICDIPASPVFGFGVWMQVVYILLVGSFKATVLTVVFSYLEGRWLGILKWIALVEMLLLSLTNCLCYNIYGMGISRKLINVVLETNKHEAVEFIGNFMTDIVDYCLSADVIIFAGAFAALFVFLRYLSKRLFLWIIGVLSVSGCAVFVIFSINYSCGRTAHSLNIRLIKYYKEISASNRLIREQMSMLTDFPEDAMVTSRHLADDIVVVIGESASVTHLSAYGYPLSTTPFLEACGDSVFLFRDAIGSSASTSGNMERILTFKPDDETYGDGYRFPTVVDLFKHAGYKTFWLSNQERVGSVSNLSGVLNSRADVIKYIGADSSEDALLRRYDEDLIDEVREALSDTSSRKIVFVHLMGSHVDYFNRYPSGADYFSADDEITLGNRPWLTGQSAGIVAAYDNSIRYTDSVLNCIRHEVALEDKPAVMLYFSDHGENVYDEGNRRGRGPAFVRVPFVVYLNSAYIERNRNIVRQIEGALMRPFSTANLVHSLMTLSGTECESLYDGSRDVLSDDYVRRVRYVDEVPWEYDTCE